MAAPKWFRSSYRLLPTQEGRVFGVIHHVRFDKKKGQVGGHWYYSPAYPDRETAKKNVRYAMKDLSKWSTALVKPFNGDLETIDPDAWVWRPLE